MSSNTEWIQRDGEDVLVVRSRKYGASAQDVLSVGVDADGGATLDIAASHSLSVGKRSVTVGHADLTEAVNGTAQVIDIGVDLPANAVVLGHSVVVATPFSGGSVSACVLDVGGTDADAIVKDLELITDQPTEAERIAAAGIKPQGGYSAQQLVATFTPDGGHALSGLSAGACTIEVFFAVVA